jgi:hypothetical protein
VTGDLETEAKIRFGPAERCKASLIRVKSARGIYPSVDSNSYFERATASLVILFSDVDKT